MTPGVGGPWDGSGRFGGSGPVAMNGDAMTACGAHFEGADACWFRPSRPHGDTTKTGLDTLYGAEVDVRFPPGTRADFPLGKSFGVALYRNSPQPSESLLNSGYFPADLEGSKKRALLASSFGKWDGCWARVTGVYIGSAASPRMGMSRSQGHPTSVLPFPFRPTVNYWGPYLQASTHEHLTG